MRQKILLASIIIIVLSSAVTADNKYQPPENLSKYNQKILRNALECINQDESPRNMAEAIHGIFNGWFRDGRHYERMDKTTSRLCTYLLYRSAEKHLPAAMANFTALFDRMKQADRSQLSFDIVALDRKKAMDYISSMLEETWDFQRTNLQKILFNYCLRTGEFNETARTLLGRGKNELGILRDVAVYAKDCSAIDKLIKNTADKTVRAKLRHITEIARPHRCMIDLQEHWEQGKPYHELAAKLVAMPRDRVFEAFNYASVNFFPQKERLLLLLEEHFGKNLFFEGVREYEKIRKAPYYNTFIDKPRPADHRAKRRADRDEWLQWWRTFPAKPRSCYKKFAGFIKKYPEHPGANDAAYLLARYYEENGQVLKALRYYKKAMTLPDRGWIATVARFRFKALADLCCDEGVLRAAKRFCQDDEYLVEFLDYTVALCHFRQLKFKKAQEAFWYYHKRHGIETPSSTASSLNEKIMPLLEEIRTCRNVEAKAAKIYKLGQIFFHKNKIASNEYMDYIYHHPDWNYKRNNTAIIDNFFRYKHRFSIAQKFFDRIVQKYPKTEVAEKAMFSSALCDYRLAETKWIAKTRPMHVKCLTDAILGFCEYEIKYPNGKFVKHARAGTELLLKHYPVSFGNGLSRIKTISRRHKKMLAGFGNPATLATERANALKAIETIDWVKAKAALKHGTLHATLIDALDSVISAKKQQHKNDPIKTLTYAMQIISLRHKLAPNYYDDTTTCPKSLWSLEQRLYEQIIRATRNSKKQEYKILHLKTLAYLADFYKEKFDYYDNMDDFDMAKSLAEKFMSRAKALPAQPSHAKRMNKILHTYY